MAVDAGDSWALLASGMLADQLMDQGIGVTTRDSPDARRTGMALASGAADIAIIPLQSSPYPTQAIAWYTTLLGPPGVDGSQDWMNYNDPALNAHPHQCGSATQPGKGFAVIRPSRSRLVEFDDRVAPCLRSRRHWPGRTTSGHRSQPLRIRAAVVSTDLGTSSSAG